MLVVGKRGGRGSLGTSPKSAYGPVLHTKRLSLSIIFLNQKRINCKTKSPIQASFSSQLSRIPLALFKIFVSIRRLRVYLPLHFKLLELIIERKKPNFALKLTKCCPSLHGIASCLFVELMSHNYGSWWNFNNELLRRMEQVARFFPKVVHAT